MERQPFFEDARGFLRTIPVAGKNIRAADENFFVLAGFHFDAGTGLANAAGFGGKARVIHGADAAGFREAINLPDGNAKHRKKVLGFRSKRRGAAHEAAKIGAEAFADFAEDEFLRAAKSQRPPPDSPSILFLPGRAAFL